MLADEDAEEVCARQAISDQTLENASHELQLTCIFLSQPHTPSWAGLRGTSP
jgi:hypothetical protein